MPGENALKGAGIEVPKQSLSVRIPAVAVSENNTGIEKPDIKTLGRISAKISRSVFRFFRIDSIREEKKWI